MGMAVSDGFHLSHLRRSRDDLGKPFRILTVSLGVVDVGLVVIEMLGVGQIHWHEALGPKVDTHPAGHVPHTVAVGHLDVDSGRFFGFGADHAQQHPGRVFVSGFRCRQRFRSRLLVRDWLEVGGLHNG